MYYTLFQAIERKEILLHIRIMEAFKEKRDPSKRFIISQELFKRGFLYCCKMYSIGDCICIFMFSTCTTCIFVSCFQIASLCLGGNEA